MGCATSCDFWIYLDPKQRALPPTKPVIPDHNKYQICQSAVAEHDQRLFDAQAQVNQLRNRNPGVHYDELSDDGMELYRLVCDIYDRKYKLWEKYRESRSKIATWMQSTVDQQLQLVYCKSNRPVVE